MVLSCPARPATDITTILTQFQPTHYYFVQRVSSVTERYELPEPNKHQPTDLKDGRTLLINLIPGNWRIDGAYPTILT